MEGNKVRRVKKGLEGNKVWWRIKFAGRHRQFEVVPRGGDDTAVRTGLQINGWRGEIDTDEKIRRRTEFDLYYIENWSLWFDLKILFLTPIRLLNTDNAY